MVRKKRGLTVKLLKLLLNKKRSYVAGDHPVDIEIGLSSESFEECAEKEAL